ncbi:MAG: glycoside hydrolase, partial [Cytophagaceae bacterium]
MIQYRKTIGLVWLIGLLQTTVCLAQSTKVLSTEKLKNYVTSFNSIDDEAVINHVPNAQSFDWLSRNIPLFDCPDSTLQTVYY